jgi:hypothetical protein
LGLNFFFTILEGKKNSVNTSKFFFSANFSKIDTKKSSVNVSQTFSRWKRNFEKKSFVNHELLKQFRTFNDLSQKIKHNFKLNFWKIHNSTLHFLWKSSLLHASYNNFSILVIYKFNRNRHESWAGHPLILHIVALISHWKTKF